MAAKTGKKNGSKPTISREWLENKLAQLRHDFKQAEGTMNALHGAIQVVEQQLAELSEKADKPVN